MEKLRSAAMGPVTQEDPIGIAGGLNLYGYANGDPINFSDPFGLDACMRLRSDEAREKCRERMKALSEDEEVQEGAKEFEQCFAAAGVALATGLGDLSFGLGFGRAAIAGAKAYGNGLVARTLAGQELVRDLAPAAVEASQAFVAAGIDTGARTALGSAGGSAATNTAAGALGSSVSFLDFVPGFASGRAFNTARQRCGG